MWNYNLPQNLYLVRSAAKGWAFVYWKIQVNFLLYIVERLWYSSAVADYVLSSLENIVLDKCEG